MAGERTEMRRPAVEMTAAMMPPAEMVSATPMMATTMMTAAAAAATVPASMTTAASRDGKVRYRQRHCEDNGGNSQRDL
jgi:hypothetical protein